MICRKCTLVALLLFSATAFASGKPSPKGGTVIDQGTFGIFQGGNRVGTETFVIRQYADTSVTTAQLRSEGPSAKDQQSVELALHADGTLDHYQWDQLSPKNSATVVVNDNLLTMHVNAEGKLSDVPFFLTPDVFVLDDYFFAAREVLIWRYLAIACKPRPGGGCDLERTRIPILIPRRHTSDQAFVELKGIENTPMNGRPQQLRHYLLQTDGSTWHLWLDSDLKLVRISIPETNTEILRQDK
jgi:hypothetical protein